MSSETGNPHAGAGTNPQDYPPETPGTCSWTDLSGNPKQSHMTAGECAERPNVESFRPDR
jgi:hypothetical protein